MEAAAALGYEFDSSQDPLVRALSNLDLADPATLELSACLLLAMVLGSDAPDADGRKMVIACVEDRRQAGAGLLAAWSLLAPPALAALARAGLQRLHEAGIRHPREQAIGALEPVEARRAELPCGELLLAKLRRPGEALVQVACVLVPPDDRGDCPPVGCLTIPGEPGDAETMMELRELDPQLLGFTHPRLRRGRTRRVSLEQLSARVAAGLESAVAAGVAVPAQLALPLPLIARALTGSPDGLPRLAVDLASAGEPPPLDVGYLDDAERHQLIGELIEEFGEWLKSEGLDRGDLWEHGDFVAGSLLQWKLEFTGDTHLGRWIRLELRDYLLDYFPRKISSDNHDALIAVTPDCLAAFMRFLDGRGSLVGEPLPALLNACRSLRSKFEREARDRANWGPAKSMVMAMFADGVDPEDRRAAARWVAAYNLRLAAMPERPAHDTATPRPANRQARRKAARDARRRNRR